MIKLTASPRHFEARMKKAIESVREFGEACAAIMPPTARQQAARDCIIRFRGKHKFSPTYRELGEMLKITPANARKHVLALVAKGLLSHTEGTARSIVIEGNENIPLGEPENAVE
jgi:hypothetical protein